MDSRLYEQFAAVEEDHWWWYGRRALVFSFLESLPSSTPRPRLLDFGCGTGALLKHLPPAFEGFGIDSSSDAVEQCKKRGLKNVVQSDGGPLPFADGFLDCVLMLDVLEHLDSEDGRVPVLEEEWDVDRNGARVRLAVDPVGRSELP